MYPSLSVGIGTYRSLIFNEIVLCKFTGKPYLNSFDPEVLPFGSDLLSRRSPFGPSLFPYICPVGNASGITCPVIELDRKGLKSLAFLSDSEDSVLELSFLRFIFRKISFSLQSVFDLFRFFRICISRRLLSFLRGIGSIFGRSFRRGFRRCLFWCLSRCFRRRF